MRIDQLARVTAGASLNSDFDERTFRGVSIDSRALRAGELFVALHGERVDGHNYLGQAAEAGAGGAIIDASTPNLSEMTDRLPVVKVADSHQALIDLARSYRDTVGARRIGITGSNGKTTTKEYAFCLLDAVESNVYRSPGNLNNLYGMPLSLLRMPEDTKMAVLEMGISRPGEMNRLAEIVEPHMLVVTNVGPSHLEFLGSVEGVACAKLEALNFMNDDSVLVINGDDAILTAEASRLRTDYTTFGMDKRSTFYPDAVQSASDGSTDVVIEGYSFRIPTFGAYQVYNLLAAYSIVRCLGYSFDEIDTGAIDLGSVPLRGEMVDVRGARFLVDCYNANPDSVRAGLESLATLNTSGRTIIVLGDMLELGEQSARLHREIGHQLAATKFDMAVMVGPMSCHTADRALADGVEQDRIVRHENSKDAAEALLGVISKGDLVYLKGSRGMELEVIYETFRSREERS